MRGIGRDLPKLSHEEQVALKEAGTEEALNKLIESSIPLAIHVANSVINQYAPGTHADRREDAVAAALLGLTEAAHRWAPEKGKLMAYASFAIKEKVIKSLRDAYRPAKISDYHKQQLEQCGEYVNEVAVELDEVCFDGEEAERRVDQMPANLDGDPHATLEAKQSLHAGHLLRTFNGEDLRRALRENGVANSEFARLAGCHVSLVKKFLSGRLPVLKETRETFLGLVWPYVRGAVERRARLPWDSPGNPFLQGENLFSRLVERKQRAKCGDLRANLQSSSSHR